MAEKAGSDRGRGLAAVETVEIPRGGGGV